MKYRKIKELNFLYEISKDGVVRNVKSKKIIKPKFKNYWRINLSKGYKQPGTYLVHRLQLMTWSPRPDMDTLEVDHINRDSSDNSFNNLRWVTSKENSSNVIFSFAIPCKVNETGIYYKSIADAAKAITELTGGPFHSCRIKLSKKGYFKGYSISKMPNDYPVRE